MVIRAFKLDRDVEKKAMKRTLAVIDATSAYNNHRRRYDACGGYVARPVA